MLKHRLLFLSILTFSAVLFAAGCAPSQQPAAAPSPVESTQALIPTSTPTRRPEPTNTPIPPTATVTSSPTTVPTETLTNTPAPQTDFSEATLYTAGFLPKWRYFFAVKVPSDTIEGNITQLWIEIKNTVVKSWQHIPTGCTAPVPCQPPMTLLTI